MRVFMIFIQIIMFPLSIFIVSMIVNIWASKRNVLLSRICNATIFTTLTYVIGGLILFPLYMAFKPVKIEGITYLLGSSLWIYWLLSFFIITPAVYISISYFHYYRKVPVKNYYKEALFLGLYSVPLSLFMEIVIYVYWRKTIPSISFYFLGKNFPWIDINWIVVFISIFISAYLSKRHEQIKNK